MSTTSLRTLVPQGLATWESVQSTAVLLGTSVTSLPFFFMFFFLHESCGKSYPTLALVGSPPLPSWQGRRCRRLVDHLSPQVRAENTTRPRRFWAELVVSVLHPLLEASSDVRSLVQVAQTLAFECVAH